MPVIWRYGFYNEREVEINVSASSHPLTRQSGHIYGCAGPKVQRTREEVHFRAFRTYILLPDFAIAYYNERKSARIKPYIDTIIIRVSFANQSLSRKACRNVYNTMHLLYFSQLAMCTTHTNNFSE